MYYVRPRSRSDNNYNFEGGMYINNILIYATNVMVYKNVISIVTVIYC